ncbi:MAG: glycosyltransferase family 1 protein [Ruminococcus sp.]|nr:glycosyltransferase family 1 protein [Ruminococcus sp.]
MKKIRIAMIMNDFNMNGISMVVLNYCRYIDKNKFDVTILTGTPVAQPNSEECAKLGVKVKMLPSRKESSAKFYLALLKEVSGKKYDIVHVHGNSAMITPELFISFLKGVRVRIAHSHNSTCDHMRMHKLLLPFFNMFHNHGFACSSLAGNWLFKNGKFDVIPNGFDVERFRFNPEMRAEIRRKLGLEDKFIIGHIGRFNNQKNHPFLLDVFEKAASANKNIYLVLVGGGPDYEKIKALIDKHPFKERIVLYGETACTEEVYNAMDVFVFPSKYEGLGIVLLEAQICGLPCVTSDVVPPEAIISENTVALSLDSGAAEWSRKILSMYEKNRAEVYDRDFEKIQKYNIRKNVCDLEAIYAKLVK